MGASTRDLILAASSSRGLFENRKENHENLTNSPIFIITEQVNKVRPKLTRSLEPNTGAQENDSSFLPGTQKRKKQIIRSGSS